MSKSIIIIGAGMLGHTPAFLKNLKWIRMSMADFGERFSDPFLRKAFPLLVYSNPSLPVFLHLMRHACGCHDDIAWPVGASNAFVDGIASRYNTLGGSLSCGRKIDKIIAAGGMFGNRDMTAPGLDHFYFVGNWATSAGALFLNAMSGKNAIKKLCKREGLKFTANRP